MPDTKVFWQLFHLFQGAMLPQNGPGQDELLCWTMSRCSYLKSHKQAKKTTEKKYYQPQFRNKKLKRKAIVLPKKNESLTQNQEA